MKIGKVESGQGEPSPPLPRNWSARDQHHGILVRRLTPDSGQWSQVHPLARRDQLLIQDSLTDASDASSVLLP